MTNTNLMKEMRIDVGNISAYVMMHDYGDVFSVSWNAFSSDSSFVCDCVAEFRNIDQANLWYRLMSDKVGGAIAKLRNDKQWVSKLHALVYGGH